MKKTTIPPTPTQAEYAKRAAREDHPMFRAEDPITYFAQWLAEATKHEVNDPNAMTLSTVDSQGLPDSRLVLLKGIDDRGFVFYTNSNSAKAEQLLANGKAALCFQWKSLRCQVRVRGPVAKVSKQESDAYFAERARGSQIGAWASDQSSVIQNRTELEAAVEKNETRFAGHEVIRPPHWYGWRVKPLYIEFWQDGAYRLHDRRRFHRARIGARWQTERLSP